jgi:NADH-quinone oxidoreductase subunit L
MDGKDVLIGPTLNFRELKDEVNIEATGVRKWLIGEPSRNAGTTFWGMPLIFVVCVFLFIGACGKSAQIPLYVWLPDAMAGPTPVSALIHAATMVTAGVYMIARLNFLFALSPAAMTVVACTGTLTALFAASIGFFQYDIKKVLAYSTVSQLGFMFIGVGVGAYWAGVYHLLTHAFFKACLFLGSGSVILGCHHEQDMRKMGGLQKHMPTTARTYLYACIAISGFPIANGFFSKDVILGSAFAAGSNLLIPGWILWAVGWVAAAGTSYYMWRSYYMTFTGEYRGGAGHVEEAGHATTPHSDDAKAAAHADPGDHGAHGAHGSHGAPAAAHTTHAPAEPEEHGHHGGNPHESPASMTWVLVTLAVGIGLTVLLGIDDFVHVLTGGGFLESLSLEKWLDPVLTAAPLVASRREEVGKGVELGLMAASVAVAFGGWLTARFLYKDNAHEHALLAFKERNKALWTVVYNKYYVDEAYGATVIAGSHSIARTLSWFDQNVLDRLVILIAQTVKFIGFIDGAIDKYVVDGLVNAFANGVISAGREVRKFETGRIEFYLYTAFAGALIVVGINYAIR